MDRLPQNIVRHYFLYVNKCHGWDLAYTFKITGVVRECQEGKLDRHWNTTDYHRTACSLLILFTEQQKKHRSVIPHSCEYFAQTINDDAMFQTPLTRYLCERDKLRGETDKVVSFVARKKTQRLEAQKRVEVRYEWKGIVFNPLDSIGAAVSCFWAVSVNINGHCSIVTSSTGSSRRWRRTTPQSVYYDLGQIDQIATLASLNGTTLRGVHHLKVWPQRVCSFNARVKAGGLDFRRKREKCISRQR